jgi:predicted Zn-dependent peptidase
MKKTALHRSRLSNGIRVIYLHTPNDPISACHLFLPDGSAFDSAAKGGLSTLGWSLITKGTKYRNARQIAEDVESMGASIGGGATHDYSEVSCHAVSVDFVKTLAIMSETLLCPSFQPEEIEKERASLIAGIKSKKDSLFTVASERLNATLYGSHPYARSSSGTEQSVSKLTRAHLVQWHKTQIHPNGAVLCVASDIAPKLLQPELERLLGSSAWPRGKQTVRAIPKTKLVAAPKHLRFQEKFEQAFIAIGYSAPGLADKDYLPLKVFNALLGGGMSTRLFQRLREERGLAYDVGSYYASKKAGSSFVIYMGLQAAHVAEALQRIEDLVKETVDKPLPATEVRDVKNYIYGSHILDHQTNNHRARYLGWWSILGMDPNFDFRYPALVQKISGEQIRRVAQKIVKRPSITVEIKPA